MPHMRHLHLSSPALVSALLLLSTPAEASSSDSAPTSRIAHGETVKSCGFAPVILGPKNCTATLVHPKLVICAAHCGTQIRSVSFGESTMKPGRRVAVDYCKKHPEHPDNEGTDWSFCVLKEEVTDIPIIPPAFGCELDEHFKVGQKVTQVGFGANQGKHPQVTGGGIKRWGENEITEMGFTHADNIKVGPNSKNVVGCPGDSGGPLLVKVKDGSWRTVAIASRYSGNCGAENPFNIYAGIKKAVTWIEKESKIDITPCFDSDGTWNPTKECGGFYSGGSGVEGSWDSGCKDAPKSGYSSTCGDPFGELPAPKISVSAPKADSVIESDELPAKVEIKADIQGKKPEQLSIGLVIDGKELQDSAKTKGPWTWERELDEGQHEIALWFDIGKQKRQQSEAVQIEVKEKATEPKPDPSKKDSEKTPSEKPTEQSPSPESKKPESKDKDTPTDSQEPGSNKKDSAKKSNANAKPPAEPGGCRSASGSSGIVGGTFLLGLLSLGRRRRQ